MTRLPMLACASALSLSFAAHATEPAYSERFSPAFRAAVDAGMVATREERTRLLTQAMHDATDDEVFYVFPLMFPADLIQSAKDKHLCSAELTASLGNIEAYLATADAKRAAFPRDNATKVRADTDQLIACLSQSSAP